MHTTPTGIRLVVVALPFLFGSLAASCGLEDTGVSPPAPGPPEARPKTQRSTAVVSPATAPESRSVAASPVVPDAAQNASRTASIAVQQAQSPNFQAFDAALEELLTELPVVIEQAVDVGQSKASVNASLVPGFMGIVARLVTLRDDTYIPARPETMNSARSVPCTECSDNLTSCLDDALDNFVDCVFDCGFMDGDCRRDCKEAWRSEKAACYEAHRDCTRRCTPK